MSTAAMKLAVVSAGGAAPIDAVPRGGVDDLHRCIVERMAAGDRLAALFVPRAAELWAVLADDAESVLRLGRAEIEGGAIPSITPGVPAAHLFEREIAEQGITVEGHPWLKPVRRQPSLPGDAAATAFYRVEGPDVHEVAVGPIHAGIIEPGHFRFQCHGERVLHLEISLGFQHRGVERALRGGPDRRTVHMMETAAGDTTLGHAAAYAGIVEALSAAVAPPRAQLLRGVMLELERLANHVGDLGVLASEVGFLPTASFCGRLRGEYLNMTALVCGNRFGRGMVRPGGCGFDVDAGRVTELLERLDAAERDTAAAVELLWETPSVMARYEEIGRVPRDVAKRLGMVGPAGRASGLSCDARQDHPTGIYRLAHIPPAVLERGDVLARAMVRWAEVQRSIVFIREQMQAIPGGPIRVATGELTPSSVAVSMAEGWRGEVCHVGITDERGRFAGYKVIDPSFRNWAGLAYAMRGGEISDFPLCNKSFNLSYCGHDL